MLIKIKISVAGVPSTSIKTHNNLTSISKFLPNSGSVWQNCEFFVNEQIENPDYWIIIDDIESAQESVFINPKRVFFLTAEVPFVTSYFDDQKFLSQFEKTFSPHAIFSQNNFVSLPFLPFMINTVHGESVFNADSCFNYDHMLQNNDVLKTKTISMIASNKGSSSHKMTEFHQTRYFFALKLKEYFKDKIDLFGYGHNEIKTKVDAIIPYKYHICLENQSTPNVITEKLYDSFLGLSYPIYWGAPNINDYFDKDSLTSINIFDFRGSIEKIERVLEENLFEKNLNALIKAKKDSLNKYGFLQRIAEICQDDLKNNLIETNDSKRFVTISSRKILQPKKVKKRISRILKLREKIVDLIK